MAQTTGSLAFDEQSKPSLQQIQSAGRLLAIFSNDYQPSDAVQQQCASMGTSPKSHYARDASSQLGQKSNDNDQGDCSKPQGRPGDKDKPLVIDRALAEKVMKIKLSDDFLGKLTQGRAHAPSLYGEPSTELDVLLPSRESQTGRHQKSKNSYPPSSARKGDDQNTANRRGVSTRNSTPNADIDFRKSAASKQVTSHTTNHDRDSAHNDRPIRGNLSSRASARVSGTNQIPFSHAQQAAAASGRSDQNQPYGHMNPSYNAVNSIETPPNIYGQQATAPPLGWPPGSGYWGYPNIQPQVYAPQYMVGPQRPIIVAGEPRWADRHSQASAQTLRWVEQQSAGSGNPPPSVEPPTTIGLGWRDAAPSHRSPVNPTPRDSHGARRSHHNVPIVTRQEKPTVFAGRGWIPAHPLSMMYTEHASPQSRIVLPDGLQQHGPTMTYEEWTAIQERGLEQERMNMPVGSRKVTSRPPSRPHQDRESCSQHPQTGPEGWGQLGRSHHGQKSGTRDEDWQTERIAIPHIDDRSAFVCGDWDDVRSRNSPVSSLGGTRLQTLSTSAPRHSNRQSRGSSRQSARRRRERHSEHDGPAMQSRSETTRPSMHSAGELTAGASHTKSQGYVRPASGRTSLRDSRASGDRRDGKQTESQGWARGEDDGFRKQSASQVWGGDNSNQDAGFGTW